MSSNILLPALAAAELHDIAPPVDYSLIPPWLVFLVSFVALALIGYFVWRFLNRRPPAKPPQLPRDRALEALDAITLEIETTDPYQFSIRVSDILRRYVTEQYAFPVTRQTSIEFLNSLTSRSPFQPEEKALLEDFLNRCDLIKFARYEATTSDSGRLLDEAVRFVKGASYAAVPA